MKSFIQSEWQRAALALKRLDVQAAVVLLAATVLVLLQKQIGARSFYTRVLDNPLGFENVALAGWGWWFVIQGVTGFVIPALILMIGLRRSPSAIGLGLGDWRFAGKVAAVYVPLVVVGTWVLSAQPAFQAQYPHLHSATSSWNVFLIYEALFLFYWLGWEYLWRGFVLFGTAPAVGAPLAIVIQTVPFAILHAGKPIPETYLSIVGALVLGAIVWRCRSFWIAVPLHAAQMLSLDLFCTLRARTGAEGIGMDALRQVLGFG